MDIYEPMKKLIPEDQEKLYISHLEKLMEEMSNSDPKDFGKRQPGERNAYEDANRRRVGWPPVGSEVPTEL